MNGIYDEKNFQQNLTKFFRILIKARAESEHLKGVSRRQSQMSKELSASRPPQMSQLWDGPEMHGHLSSVSPCVT